MTPKKRKRGQDDSSGGAPSNISSTVHPADELLLIQNETISDETTNVQQDGNLCHSKEDGETSAEEESTDSSETSD